VVEVGYDGCSNDDGDVLSTTTRYSGVELMKRIELPAEQTQKRLPFSSRIRACLAQAFYFLFFSFRSFFHSFCRINICNKFLCVNSIVSNRWKMKKYFVILCMVAILFGVGCEKEVIELVEDVTPPVVSDFAVVVTDSSVAVSWVTDEPCSVEVRYWTSDKIVERRSDPEYRQNHTVVIEGLKDSTTYRYCAISYDMWDNFTVSDTFYFTTRLNLRKILLNAWKRFEAGDYQVAFGEFERYIEFGGDSLDAYCGLAWSKFFIDYSDTSVYRNFSKVIGLQPNNTDALAGLSYYAYCDSDFVGAVDFGRELLTVDSNYVFIHDTTINYIDINIIIARGLFELEIYQNVENYIGRVMNVYVDEDDPDTWVVDGVKFDTYEEALDKLIEIAEKNYLYLPGL